MTGDREKVVQIFQNLLENAVIHGNPHRIEVRRHKAKDGMTIVVTNDGQPIPQKDRQVVFRRGFPTKNKSSGLGLAIVQKLVEAHGWKITLDNTRETAFRILIPVRE